jgi:TRAP-type C4-dicarboxylate transport system permease small subunit
MVTPTQRVVRTLKVIERVVVPTEKGLVLILMLGVSLSVGAGIVFRLMSITVPWTNELAQNLLVWLMFIGANLGIYYREHMAVTLLPDHLQGRARTIVIYASQVGFLIFCVYIVISGTFFVVQQRMLGGSTFALPVNIPKYVLAMVLPLSFLAGTLHLLRELLEMDPTTIPRGAALAPTSQEEPVSAS